MKVLNDVIECIERRASVRTYKDEPLTETELCTLMNAALRAPSAGNLLNYSVVAVTDQGVKDNLFELMGRQPFVKKAPLTLIFNVDEHRTQKWLERYGGHFHFDGLYLYGIAFSDALIAAQNVVLAAQAIGLGSVYVGNVLGRARSVRSLLGYPRHVVPVGMLCIGRPITLPETRERLPIRAILHQNRYNDYSDEEITALYAKLEAEWSSRNPDGLTVAGGVTVKSRAEWTVNAHYTEAGIRAGDEELRQALIEAGFRI